MGPEKKGGLSETVVINAGTDDVKDVLLDFESYPEWMSKVVGMEVLERDKQGRGTRVKYRVDAIAVKISYVLEWSYEDNRFEMKLVEGDLDDVNASYVLEPLDDDRTEVTYYYDVTYSLPRALKGPLAKRLTKQVDKFVMKSALKDLKKRVES